MLYRMRAFASRPVDLSLVPMPLAAFLVEDNRTIRDNLIPALEDLADAEVVGMPKPSRKPSAG